MQTVEHLLSAANYITLAIEELDYAGNTVTVEIMQAVFRHVLQLIAILDERS